MASSYPFMVAVLSFDANVDGNRKSLAITLSEVSASLHRKAYSMMFDT